VGDKQFGKIWVDLLADILEHGENVRPRGLGCRELRNVQIEAPLEFNILYHPIRDLNYRFMIAEWLWIAFGLNELKYLSRYNSVMSRFSDDGETLYGSYGTRWDDQLVYVIENLKKDRDSRQAVCTLWTPNPPQSKDIPCTISWQFLVRAGKLHMTANMRSSDAWLGLPYDWFVFSQMANCIATLLDIHRGTLTMNLASSHLYEEHYPQAKAVTGSPEDVRTIQSPLLMRYPSYKMLELFKADNWETEFNSIPHYKLMDELEIQYIRALEKTSNKALEVLKSVSTLY
jgi:thymidylate synthase